MMEPAGADSAELRAFLRVGGISLARHQLGLALALGCERIVCIARGLRAELVELQHVAEDDGARFHVVTGPRGLVGLVAANDELVVFADGLLAAPGDVIAQVEAGQGVLVQPIEIGQPGGFERIDLNHAAAGAMRLSGALVERFAELPADCDAVSSLQRIALQAGLAQRMLTPGLRESGAWRLVRDEGEAQHAETEWFRQHTAVTGASSASEIGARIAVRSLGPALLHSGSGGNALGFLALAAVLLALGAGWFQFSATALFLCAATDVLRRAASLLLRIERQSLNLRRSILPRRLLFGWGLDLVLILVLGWSRPMAPGEGAFAHVFPPIMLVAMLRLIPQVVHENWVRWLEDRGLFGLLLALTIVAAGGMPDGLIAALAVMLAVLGVAWPNRPTRLTRV
ncbi:MAG: hypothetical protein QM676_06285 [Novosphingobium sp.]